MGLEEVPSLRREQHPYWEEEGGLALKLTLGGMLHGMYHTSIKSFLKLTKFPSFTVQLQVILIIGPESDHWLCLSLTP